MDGWGAECVWDEIEIDPSVVVHGVERIVMRVGT